MTFLERLMVVWRYHRLLYSHCVFTQVVDHSDLYEFYFNLEKNPTWRHRQHVYSDAAFEAVSEKNGILSCLCILHEIAGTRVAMIFFPLECHISGTNIRLPCLHMNTLACSGIKIRKLHVCFVHCGDKSMNLLNSCLQAKNYSDAKLCKCCFWWKRGS